MARINVRKFMEADLPRVCELTMRVIKTCYPPHYPPEAIEYFISRHTPERVLADSTTGHVLVLETEGQIIATGTLDGTHVSRVFVDPEWQKHGLGRQIMSRLENEALRQDRKFLQLDSSLPAKPFYDKLGYTTLAYSAMAVRNGKELRYYRMAKPLAAETSKAQNQGWNLDGRKFRTFWTQGSGALANKDTIFVFSQHGRMLIASFEGGNIMEGELIGVIDGDVIHYVANHRTGDGKSVTTSGQHTLIAGEDGGIRLVFEQELTGGRRGVCVMEEAREVLTEFREMREEDIPAVSKLAAELAKETAFETRDDYTEVDESADDDDFAAELQLSLFRADRKVLVATEGGDIKGYMEGRIGVNPLPFAKITKTGRITAAYVRPEFRGHGFFKRLEMKMTDFFKQKGVLYCDTAVMSMDRNAKDSWTALGYGTYREEMRKKL